MKKLAFPQLIIRLLIIQILLSISFISCKKDDKEEDTPPVVEEEKFFRLDVKEYLPESSISVHYAWFLLYSEDNELIISQMLESNTVYNYDTISIPQKNLQAQIIKYTQYSPGYDTLYENRVEFRVYANVKPGDWILGSSSSEEPELLGEVELSLNDINFSQNEIVELKTSYNYAGIPDFNNVVSIPQYSNPDYVWLLLLNHDEVPKYKYFDEVALNASLSVSQVELEEMNTYKDVSFPDIDSKFLYVESEDDYSSDYWDFNMVYMESGNSGETSLRAYYPDHTFPGYYCYFRASKGAVSNNYISSRGEIPAVFETLDVQYSVKNKNLTSFDCDIQSNSDIAIIRWEAYNSSESINCSYSVYFSPETSFSYEAPPVIAEISELIPGLVDFSEFQYYSVTNNDFNLTEDYDAYIKRLFIDNLGLYSEKLIQKRQIIYDNDKMNIDVNDLEVIKNLKRNPVE